MKWNLWICQPNSNNFSAYCRRINRVKLKRTQFPPQKLEERKCQLMIQTISRMYLLLNTIKWAILRSSFIVYWIAKMKVLFNNRAIHQHKVRKRESTSRKILRSVKSHVIMSKYFIYLQLRLLKKERESNFLTQRRRNLKYWMKIKWILMKICQVSFKSVWNLCRNS